MRKLNLPLLIGSILLGSLIFISLFNQWIITKDPYEITTFYEEEIKGEIIPHHSPYPPGDEYIWGSDILGRDLYSRIITGAEMTLKIALYTTLLKFFFSLPIAFLAGFKNKVCTWLIQINNGIFNGIPAMIFALFILKLSFIENVTIELSIFVFALVIAIGDWARVGKIIDEKIKDVLNMNFIEGEIAIGKSRFQIAYKNILPHIFPTLIIHFFLEMGQSILFIAKLGVFGAFVGAAQIYTGPMSNKQEMGISFDPEFFPEWGGMLFSSRYALSSGRPWVVLFTATAVFITILAFNMFGEGLKRKFEH